MGEGRPRPFYERFDIEVGADEARKRFVNRVNDYILYDFMNQYVPDSYNSLSFEGVSKYVAFVLGEPHSDLDLRTYVRGDYVRCLQVIEALYNTLDSEFLKNDLSKRIDIILRTSEVDLGMRWQPPAFVRTGAQLLDEHLVDEPLRWLSEPQFESVRKPFNKGLSHYVEAQNRPARLADVITDMYEATEALAKVVTGKDRDLSNNRELFIKSIHVSDYYKRLLKDYIQYGSEFRHAERPGKPRPLSEPEVESFIYLTGLFIRLAIRAT